MKRFETWNDVELACADEYTRAGLANTTKRPIQLGRDDWFHVIMLWKAAGEPYDMRHVDKAINDGYFERFGVRVECRELMENTR